jgi:hypothetical protein
VEAVMVNAAKNTPTLDTVFLFRGWVGWGVGDRECVELLLENIAGTVLILLFPCLPDCFAFCLHHRWLLPELGKVNFARVKALKS